MFKKSMSKKIIPIAAATTLAVTSLIGGTVKTEAATKPATGVKNVIMIVADGTGLPFYSAYRYMIDNPNTKGVMESTVFDPYFVGLQTTYANDPNQNVTDSASAATAMATGHKTYNNGIGVDVNKKPVKTVLEQAKEDGLSTGVVATSELAHATPASYAAHDESRRNMDAIADDFYNEMINGQHKVDVMLGGGSTNFVRKDKNLAELFEKDGYTYVANRDELLNDKNSKQLLGLFAKGGMSKAIDRTSAEPSLNEMTEVAIDRLSKDEDGFFLMVEASQIDWAAHDDDLVGSMSEMKEYAETFKYVMDWAEKDGQTLVIATADHSTGGFTIGADEGYNFFVEPIKAFSKTPDFISAEITKVNDVAKVEEILQKYIAGDFYAKLTSEEIQSVKDALTNAAEGKAQGAVDTAIEKIVDTHAMAGWSTVGHTGEEVPVLAYGPQSNRVAGLIDNTKHAQVIFDILAKNKEGKQSSDKKGKLTITKNINLWKREGDKLVFSRILKKGEVYNVYGLDSKFGGQYNLGGGYYVTKMNGYVKFTETK